MSDTLYSLTAVPVVGFAFTWVLTALVRRYAIASNLLDRPNARSSHTVPTPRGGGVGLVVAFIVLAATLPMPSPTILVAGALIALLGFVDDRRPVPARWRFLGHAVAAAACVAALGPLSATPLLEVARHVDAAASLLAAVYVIWMINLYNFMDGIDGIAGVEAISVCLGGALIWAWVSPGTGWTAALLLAACAAGFLVWNFPPAKIFMGDAGSGFLGLVIAALSLWAAKDHPPLLWSWLILTAAFMTDATVTLIRRVLRGEKFYLAHRSHAYQYASRLYKSHKVVTLAFGAINVFWLFPWALAVALGWIDGVLALVIAYAPLVLLAFHYKAGDRAAQGDLA